MVLPHIKMNLVVDREQNVARDSKARTRACVTEEGRQNSGREKSWVRPWDRMEKKREDGHEVGKGGKLNGVGDKK